MLCVQARVLGVGRLPTLFRLGMSQGGFRRSLSTLSAEQQRILEEGSATGNVTAGIVDKIGRGLHKRVNHPLGIIKHRLESHFQHSASVPFQCFDSLSPVVSVKQCFDDLLTPSNHVSRQWRDTYYVDENRLLRPHMTAYQTELIRAGHQAFLYSGEVFRRDTVDATHYPAFHQMDGVKLFPKSLLPSDPAVAEEEVLTDLKTTLLGAVRAIFGEVEYRWVDAEFPFTHPSLELEILYRGEWLEVLGCGVTRQEILANCGKDDHVAWAFGIGLERLAMVLFRIPDIRLFWSEDPRFTTQFEGCAASNTVVEFAPFSKFPPCTKDITFWLPTEGFYDNAFFELVREISGDLVETVELIDQFTHPKTHRESRCFRIVYRSHERNLTNAEIDEKQFLLREATADRLGVELR